MTEQMYSVSCDPVCGFVVKSHDRNEVASLAYEHVSAKHPEKNLSSEQISADVKTE
jgi:predicted small metal-binding protein